MSSSILSRNIKTFHLKCIFLSKHQCRFSLVDKSKNLGAEFFLYRTQKKMSAVENVDELEGKLS